MGSGKEKEEVSGSLKEKTIPEASGPKMCKNLEPALKLVFMFKTPALSLKEWLLVQLWPARSACPSPL